MGKTITDAEYKGVTSLTAQERYSHFVRRVADWEEIWGLRTSEGWVMVGDDSGKQMIPVWPHERYANACAIDDWADAAPTVIELEAWMTRWLPGMTRDGVQVAVFPVATERMSGVVVLPERLEKDLEAELENYE